MAEYDLFGKAAVNASVANEGNVVRLVRLMQRAEAGERLKLAFFGGSITQGCLSSTPETCYAYLVYEWFVRKFPDARFKYINAGIGGTTSQFGVTRIQEDVLRHEPDFVIVEFSVNDPSNPYFKETYEGVLRRLWYSKTEPAVMILNNLFYETGENAQRCHNALGISYDIPCISIRDAVYPQIETGKVERAELTTDNLHPNDRGHAMLAGFINRYLDHVYDKYAGEKGLELPVLPGAPVTVNAMENLRRTQNTSKRVTAEGFIADTSSKRDLRDIFKKGWYSRKKGDKLTFTFTGSELAIQYRKTVNRPAPVAVAVIDGDRDHPFVLDANFTEDWGDCLWIDTLMYHGQSVDPAVVGCFDHEYTEASDTECASLEKLAELAGRNPIRQKHTVEIEIAETHRDDKADFYLVSFITG